nr:orf4b protein [Betacoronavirus sp.]
MQQDRLPGNCIATANCQVAAFDGVIRNRKRRHDPAKKTRYAKRRFSPLVPRDVVMAELQPTHYLRVVFDEPRNWHCLSGHMFDELQRWLGAYGVSTNPDLHITLALLMCDEMEPFDDIEPLTSLLKNVMFDLCGFTVLGRTLVLNAHETNRAGDSPPVNMALPHIKEWLRVHAYNIYNSGLPLHMSIAKLHHLDDTMRAYIGSRSYLKQYITRFKLLPRAVEVVTIRNTPNSPKTIVKSLPIVHDFNAWW